MAIKRRPGRPKGSKNKPKAVTRTKGKVHVSKTLSQARNDPEMDKFIDELAESAETKEVETEVAAPVIAGPTKRKRGRPRKDRTDESPDAGIEETSPHVDKEVSSVYRKGAIKELSEKSQSILTSGTGLLSKIRPAVEMTDEEAKDICDPLSSYLLRHGVLGEKAQEFVEQFDLIAFSLATGTYVLRVWQDDKAYRDEIRRISDGELEQGSDGSVRYSPQSSRQRQNGQYAGQDDQAANEVSEIPRTLASVPERPPG